MNGTVNASSIDTFTRLCHASSNLTPLILGKISTIKGGAPIRKKLSGSVKSFALSSPTGAPN